MSGPSKKELFANFWEEIVVSHFNNEIIINALNKVGGNNEDEFKSYMKRMYERRTIDEWVKYYDQKDLTGEIVNRQKKELEPEEAINFTRNLMKRNYSKSAVGVLTKENLEKFEEKYINQKEDDYYGHLIMKKRRLLPREIVEDLESMKKEDLKKLAFAYLKDSDKDDLIKPELRGLFGEYMLYKSEDFIELMKMRNKKSISVNYNTYEFDEDHIDVTIRTLNEDEKMEYISYLIIEAKKTIIDIEDYLKKKKDEFNYGMIFRTMLKFAPINTMNEEIYKDRSYKANLKKYLELERNRLNKLIKKLQLELKFKNGKHAIKELNNKKKNNTIINDAVKNVWEGTKTEFARHITDEYEKNQKKYGSLRDASYKLFELYEFGDKKWTKEKCYDLVRKV